MKPDFTRRGFVGAGVAAATLAPHAQALAGEQLRRTVRAAPSTVQLAPNDAPLTKIWAYGGATPGTELRYKRGDWLSATLANDLPQDTTIHWHGLRLPNAMDGVPALTQSAVAPGQTFDYGFDLTDAGTYWYHSHLKGWEQVARGLHGPLIIEETNPPDVDRDLTLVIDDWRLDAEAQIEDSFGRLHDWAHAGRIGNWVTTNGDVEFKQTVRRGERLRLRLINAANARIFSLSLRGMVGVVAALDGQPLVAPEPVERVSLTPAQRVDLIVDVTADDEALVISHERDGTYSLAAFPVSGAVTPRVDPVASLEQNNVPPLGALSSATTTRLVMEGGAMGGLAEAQLGDEKLSLRQLAQRGKVWAFNGRVDPPEAPLVSAGRGQTVIINIVNDTRWPHAMHLHGHHFRRLGADGAPGPLRDTTLVAPGDRANIAFVADNPGAWLLHCHMLEHSAAGMSTWIEVA